MKTKLKQGQKLSRPTSFNKVEDVITLKAKFNKGWLVDRANSLTGNSQEFVYPERYITNNFNPQS